MSQQYGRYIADEPIGRGGMGIVYRGHDPYLKREVAIKVLNPDPRKMKTPIAKLRDLFLSEARAAAKLTHPHIVTVYDVGLSEDRHAYLVMEIVDGASLHGIYKDLGPMQPVVAARIGAELANGLACAHEAGIVHRDVKPHNALIAKDGTAKLMDFGIATFTHATETKNGLFVGSPRFASPEQLRGKALDGRADLFSLGLTIYMVLTGEHAFLRESVMATAKAILDSPLPPPTSKRKDLDPKWNEVLGKALEKDPDKRYPDCHTFALALNDLVAADSAGQVREVSDLELVVLKGPDRGRHFTFKNQVKIGRGAGDLSLTDQTVSSTHCIIERDEDEIVLRDLQSRNGTWIGSDRVRIQTIAPGTMFRVGNHTTIRMEEPDDVDLKTMTDEVHQTLMLAADSDVSRLVLVVKKGAAVGKSIPINAPVVLSRSDGAGRLGDGKVSRKHAVVEIQDDTVYLRDLASTNGTWIGSSKVREIALKVGDRFRVGDTVLELEEPPPE